MDGLLRQAREHGMRLVLLWFGSWKNSMSCYAPAWVKADVDRFPRCRDRHGRALEILTPFAASNRDADQAAFVALMRHLREVDEAHTVVMVQVENEIGLIPHARDHSPLADAAFSAPVPAPLLAQLQRTSDTLDPHVRDLWRQAGGLTAGTWEQVFGTSVWAEELFMAWHFASYVEPITAAGKAELALPMYTNAALPRTGAVPGQYPGAGPLPHLIDVWQAAAPSLDFISPDIYFPDFRQWADRYTRPDNPLFVPEALRGTDAAANALYAVGNNAAIGFCPFGIEGIEEVGDIAVNATYESVAAPSLADGVINEAGDRSRDTTRLPAAAIVIRTDELEFVVAGIGVTLTFDADPDRPGQLGILNCAEGRWQGRTWQHRRWLNGDQTHQGRHVRLEPGRFTVQRVRLYRYA